MPRPKRTKVASANTRVAASHPISLEPSKPPVPLPARRNPPRETADRIGDVQGSDTSENSCVTRARRPTRRRENPAECTMTGALGPADVVDSHIEFQKHNKAERQRKLMERQSQWENEEQRQNEEVAVQPAANPVESQATPTRVSRIKRTGVKPGSTDSISSPAARQSAAPARENTDLPGESTLLADTTLNTSSPQSVRRPLSALKARSTPGQDSSILNLKHFKRRPRQPSIARMIQLSQTGDTSRLEQDDFTDFNPEDESTPLTTKVNRAWGRQGVREPVAGSSVLAASSSSRKRKLGETEQEIQALASSPPVSSPTRERSASVSSSGSLPDNRVEQAQPNGAAAPHRQSLNLESETMAPPLSSSSLEDQELYSDADDSDHAAKKRKTTSHSHETDDRPTTRSTRAQSQRSAPVSTAALESLLPRRRTTQARHASTFDIPASSDDLMDATLDGDELQMSTPPARSISSARRRPTASKPLATKSNATSAGKKGSRTSATATATSTAQTGRITKTYGRRSSDKENDAAGSDDSDVEEDAGYEDSADFSIATDRKKSRGRTVSKELEAAARKFREIDEWKMEFEEVEDEIDRRSSSPQYR